jgi:hypothetical protein
VVVVAAAWLTSRVIADVFVGGATLGATTPMLALIAGLAVIRTRARQADALARTPRVRTKGH